MEIPVESTPVLEESEEEVDLSFLDEDPEEATTIMTRKATQSEDALDVASLLASQQPKESTEEDEPQLVLVQENEIEEMHEEVQRYLKKHVQQNALFAEQDDDFFQLSTNTSSTRTETFQEDEAIDIPTQENTTQNEEEVDLDFFDDLFDD